MPKISVIIPIYDVEKYLDKCLNSVRSQTLTSIEIICVDDCSPDNSYKIVEKHAAEDPRINFIRHEKNLGLGGARNTAIRIAKSDYIASVDSDDYIESNMLELLWEATEAGRIDVVGCGFDKVDEAGRQLSLHDFPPRTIVNEHNNINIFSIVNPAFWNKLWRRSLYIDNDIFFPNYVYFEDMATTPRILSKSKSIKIIEPCLYHYLVRDDSITNTFSSKHMLDYFKVFEILLRFLQEEELIGRYADEFKGYVNLGARFHSHKVVESTMEKSESLQYLKHFLMLKIAFFEYYDDIESMDQEKLLRLLEHAKSKKELL